MSTGIATMNDPMKDPRYWRDRAEKARQKAGAFRIGQSEKQRLLKVAAEYDRLAERAEEWQTAESIGDSHM